MSVYQEFFTELWSGLHGRAVIATMNTSNEPTNQRFFAWPEQAEDLFEYVSEHETEDVYFSPTLFRANRAMKSVVKCSHVVHADDDGFLASGGTYLLTPSLQVHTSPGHTHVYWIIADTEDPSVIEPLSHAVSVAHSKAEGTDDGWAINKLLRVPGTYNTQYANPASKKYQEDGEVYEVTLERTEAVYTVAEFSAAYAPAAVVNADVKDMGTLPTRTEALKSLPYSPTLDELLDKNYLRRHVDRSDALFLLENELFRLGASDETTFVIARDSPMNKFGEDGKPNADDLLWQDILRARAKSDIVPTKTDSVEPEVTVTVAPTRKPKSIDFLSAEEKQHMAPTFVDDFLAWASSKTDAAHEFHIASAFTILSTIFSDYGHAIPKFGRLPLNMWFMVLGETTRSRKSTTRGQMLSFIKALSDEDGKYAYDLGSDVTPEALDNALLERANRSSLVHRDEVQGWLQEMDSKAYMSGAKGKFTELFDGHVSGKLRATGDVKRKPSVNVSLVLFTMGIRGQVADFLTQEDFQSGFLTRFVYVEADAPKRTPESDYLEQADLSEVKQGDPVFTDLVSRLEQAREHWDSFVAVDGPTVAVPCSPDAWARLNRFITDILDEAEGHERHAIIEASSQRLSLSILKAATLLAMFDCCDEVQLGHMLSAINFCSSWFLHMVSMANKISESGWQRRVDQVENHLIGQGGSSRWDRCYGKFKADLKPREFMEIVQALQEAGSVHVFKDDKQIRWIETVEAA